MITTCQYENNVECILLGPSDHDSSTLSLDYIDVLRVAQRSGPISMKFLMRTKKFMGIISMGRLVLYREAKLPSHEKILDTVIPLAGPNISVKINSDHRNDKRFTIAVETICAGKTKNETYEVFSTN